jgi:glycosyltransferase involved in cell wall biosynthesis
MTSDVAQTLPTVSVVVPTYNRLPRLQRVLDALAAQTYPASRFEVVVVSDGSSDGTDEHLGKRQDPFELVAVSQPNAGPAAARNRGAELAGGSLLLFVDDDVVAAPTLIEQHVASHDMSPLVVIGPMLTPDGYDMSPWVRWEQAMLYRQYDAMKRGRYPATFRQFYTGNASVLRESMLSQHGFDTRYRRAEDVELAYRLSQCGHRFVFNANAVGYHYADRPFGSWLQTARDYGINDARFARDLGRPELLQLVGREFPRRHPIVQVAARCCVGRPRAEQAAQTILKSIASTTDALHADLLTRLSLSGLYNITYYCGLAEELGSRDAFRRVVSRRHRSPKKRTRSERA